MATVHTTALIDDLDGSPAAETVTFGVDGARYVIDLTAAHADLLRDRLARFIEASRTVPPPARRQAADRTATRTSARRAAGGPSATEVRAWAATARLVVSPRGRIPFAVLDQFRDAHR